MDRQHNSGFTLVELSIVLVIIGLIVGGVLVGRDLISAAQVRAQISQIGKFNAAVNVFYAKYQALPGDMRASMASANGFAPRSGGGGMGDGNNILQGVSGGGIADGTNQASGEVVLFWSDLTYANGNDLNLIPGSFNGDFGDVTTAQSNQRWPDAALGGGNCVYAYGGEENNSYPSSDGSNYYGVSAACNTQSYGVMFSQAGMTVAQAYAIDTKMDDGLPQSGGVTTQYLNPNSTYNRMDWAAGGGASGAAAGSAAPASASTCYDNGGVVGRPDGLFDGSQRRGTELRAVIPISVIGGNRRIMRWISTKGFTLIELSIVLVIIGFIIGSISVGRQLIHAAELRSTLAQIQHYQTAVKLFQTRFNALPGDINAQQASLFSLSPRGSAPGEGDGNGIIEGNYCGSAGCNFGSIQGSDGETSMFWVDLTTANGLNLNLIPGGFSTAHAYCCVNYPITPTSTPSDLDDFLPQAKLGGGNYVYVYSFNGSNYFGIAKVDWIAGGAWGWPSMGSEAGLLVEDAYDIDQKIDDGLPQTGQVTAQYDTGYDYSDGPAPWIGASDTSATAPSATTCYDNGNVTGGVQTYSMSQKHGAGINCVLTFQFQ